MWKDLFRMQAIPAVHIFFNRFECADARGYQRVVQYQICFVSKIGVHLFVGEDDRIVNIAIEVGEKNLSDFF